MLHDDYVVKPGGSSDKNSRFAPGCSEGPAPVADACLFGLHLKNCKHSFRAFERLVPVDFENKAALPSGTMVVS
ncbi:hypothetical protein [Bradyrhizobium retamae]|uniref:hypothetical protein n=1 Tax=Bradyrhizobium sp. RDI18 TaxID=3367400 RepID=UPI0007C6DCF2